MSRYIILTEKKWHEKLFSNLKITFANDSWWLINRVEDFNLENLSSINPDKIFIPHWSYIIPSEIIENYECIVFHMTDLPFGRGGSPLQNLIVRGLKSTKISAIRVEQKLDAGDVYIKSPLSLEGTAYEIFIRSTYVIEGMIEKVVKNKLHPVPQVGEIVEFKRRKPADSNWENLSTLEEVFDYIRMLDCEGYPHAFIETPIFKIEFNKASFDINEEIITANVRIIKK